MNEQIYQIEKEKYTNAWKDGAEGRSRTNWVCFNYLKNKLNPNWKILDIGCGDGMFVELAIQMGLNIKGMDITLEGLKQHKPIIKINQPIPNFAPKIENYYEVPIWETPFKDNEFDFVLSSDVLEHIPPNLVDKSIQEIIRITKSKMFHCIATFKDNRMKYEFHLTVQPIEWWINKFREFNNKNLEIEIVDRKLFLKQYEK